MNFTFSSFYKAGVLAETALVTDMCWTGIILLNKARTIKRLVIGMLGGWSGRCRHGIIIVTRGESNTIATRGLAALVTPIVWFMNFWGGVHHNGLGKVLKVFQGLQIKITVTMKHIILDVVLGE